MSANIPPSLANEKRYLQKQIGCMNGIFQLFDSHYFVTGRRSKRPLPGANNNRDTNSATENATGKNLKEVVQNQPRLSTDSLGTTSFSSSTCSSTFSSSDHGKTVQCRPSSFNQSYFLQNTTQIHVKQKSSSLHFSQQSPDLRDKVKDSMQREHQGISVKTTVQEEGRGRTIKHIDSPRPFQQSKNGQPIVADSDRSNRFLAKLQESPWSSKEEKDASLRRVRKDPPRSSYDGRESQDKLKSTTKLKELPRLSLDSRESSLRSSAAESRLNFLPNELQRENGTVSPTVNANQEPGSNKRPSSVVVKLMGLEAFPDSISNDEGATIKVNSYLDQDSVAKSSKKTEKSKKNLLQQIMHKDPASPGSKNARVITKPISSPKFPLETAPWRQPGAIHDSPRRAPSIGNGFRNVRQTSSSVYGEIEKRIMELEFRKSGKDLRALKQILEAMQNTRKRLENQGGEQADLMSQTSRCSSDYKCCDHQGSKASNLLSNRNNYLAPTKATISPKRFSSSVLITKSARVTENGKISSASVVHPADGSHLQKLRTCDIHCTRKDLVDKLAAKDLTPRKVTPQNADHCKPSTDNTTTAWENLKAVQTTRATQLVKVENYTAFGRSSGTVSPRVQHKTHGIKKQSCLTTQSPDLRKTRKKLIRQPTEPDSLGRKHRPKSTLCRVNDKLSSSNGSKNYSQHGDTASIRSESNSSLASITETEVTSTESSTGIKAKQQLYQKQSDGAARLGEYLPLAELTILLTEQPSPVSVLDDTFYREDSPSPVKKISTAFLDYETPIPDEAEWNFLGNELNQKKLDNIKHLLHKLSLLNNYPDEASIDQVASLCKSRSPDHKYITKMFVVSGLLKDRCPVSKAIQLLPPCHLINPDLFHVLEQTEQNSKLANEENNGRIAPLKSDQKIHRRMVFDTVNEILVRKLASDRTFMPRKRIKTGNELLRELCSQVDRLQAKTDSSVDDDDGFLGILNADMMQQPDDWADYQGEIPAVVLDIERLIFKDLITEVITAEVMSLCDWHRRRCIKQFTKQ